MKIKWNKKYSINLKVGKKVGKKNKKEVEQIGNN